MPVNFGKRLYIVDDDPAVLDSLCALVKSHHLEPIPFASAEEFIKGYDSEQPACLLLDIKMPGLDGLKLQELLVKEHAVLPVIFLTGHGDVPAAVQAMKNGALDFIEKPVDADVLLAALHEAFESMQNLPQSQVPPDEVQERLAALTAREREILDHLLMGKINKHIADDLGISQRTVEVHRARVQNKMKARNLADLIRLMSS